MTRGPVNSAPSGSRSASIEWARIIGCAGIVWFHAGAPYRTVALGGLIAFTLMGCAFIKPLRSVSELGPSSCSRAQRLLGPWIVWSVVYGALRIVEAIRQHEPAMSWWDMRMVLYGTAIHLWFLPFLFLVTIMIQSIDLVGREARVRPITIFGWLLILATPLWVWLEQWGAGKPFSQWISVLPAVGLGTLLRARAPGTNPALRRASILLMVDAIVIGATYLFMPDQEELLTKHAVGALAVLAWTSSIVASRFTLTLGALSMGVYLVHPLLLTMCGRVLGVSTQSAATASVIIVASFAISAILAMVTRRLHPTVLRSVAALSTMKPRQREAGI